MPLMPPHRIVVRGAGDLATGTILRLVHSGFQVVALESACPSSIRRTVSLSEAVYDGAITVEDITAVRAQSATEALDILRQDPRRVPILVDEHGTSLPHLNPIALVDAIIAKRNLGTRMDMAPTVVALGPGFVAGVDAHAVIETNRGHHLGRVILQGCAEPNTGIPGLIAGKGAERVMHTPAAGTVQGLRAIGDHVSAGEAILAIHGEEGRTVITTPIEGMLRGLIRNGYQAFRGLKVADVDPRGTRAHCFSASDKALSIGGGVLEAILSLAHP